MTGLAEVRGPPASPLFAAAPPELLARRALLRRVDTKYLLPRRLLAEVLAPLGRHYAALETADRGVPGYSSLYFDTPGLDCFEAHRRRRRLRHKIRIRHYPDRELSFLELKTRQSDVITLKRRLDRPYGDNQLGPRDLEFLAAHSSLVVGRLAPQVWTHFRRLTLLGLETNERVTIDIDLELVRGARRVELGGAAILEVKQTRLSRSTPVMAALRAAHVRAAAFSKYCAALALTGEGVRSSGLRPALRALEKVNR